MEKQDGDKLGIKKRKQSRCRLRRIYTKIGGRGENQRERGGPRIAQIQGITYLKDSSIKRWGDLTNCEKPDNARVGGMYQEKKGQ